MSEMALLRWLQIAPQRFYEDLADGQTSLRLFKLPAEKFELKCEYVVQFQVLHSECELHSSCLDPEI